MEYSEFMKFLIDGKMEMTLPIGNQNDTISLHSSITGKEIDPKTGVAVDEDGKVTDENGWKK